VHDESLKRVPHVLALTLCPYFATHKVNHFLCDKETEAGAGYVDAVRVLRADKFVENYFFGLSSILGCIVKKIV
jgi:hypothetical protein